MASITVSLLTFNHERYIEECIDSVLRQRGDHDIELVWFDDCSTDSTDERGKARLKGADVNLKFISPKLNRFSRRIPTRMDRYEMFTGDYICFLEGDDYWVSDTKLEKQLALLEQSGCDLCFSSAFVVDGASNDLGETLAAHGQANTIFSPQQVVDGDGGFMPTCTLVLRKEVLDQAPNWYFGYMPVGDYPMQVLGGARAGAVFLAEKTAAYRKHAQQWSAEFERAPDLEKRIGFLMEFLELLLRMSKCPTLHHLNFTNMFQNYFSQLMFKLAGGGIQQEKQIASVYYSEFLELNQGMAAVANG